MESLRQSRRVLRVQKVGVRDVRAEAEVIATAIAIVVVGAEAVVQEVVPAMAVAADTRAAAVVAAEDGNPCSHAFCQINHKGPQRCGPLIF